MHTKESITALLMRDDRVGMHAVGRALQVLAKRQTMDEVRSKQTKHLNDRGFCKSDGKRGVEDAQKYRAAGDYLSKWDLNYWRTRDAKGTPRIAKYWAQLIEEADLKAQQKREAAAQNRSDVGVHPDELDMMRMEAEGDRAQTIRDEQRKHEARAQMERF